jgi:hypothetical protein
MLSSVVRLVLTVGQLLWNDVDADAVGLDAGNRHRDSTLRQERSHFFEHGPTFLWVLRWR